MGAAKDLIIATVILAVCVLLLVQVFGKTEPIDDGQPRIPERIASNDPGVVQQQDNHVRVPPPERLVPPPPPVPTEVHPPSRVNIGIDDLMRDPAPERRTVTVTHDPVAVIPDNDTGVRQPDPIVQPVERLPDLVPVETIQPVVAPVGPRTYVILAGDELARVSQKHYGTTRYWQKIVDANPGLDPHRLLVGKKLVIPEIASVVTPNVVQAPTGPDTYVVQSGDSYYTIAQQKLGDAARHEELQALNPNKPAVKLRVGDRIQLPSRGGAAVAVPPPVERSAPAGARTHVVAEGELLGDISGKYYGTSRKWRLIADANGLADANTIKVGQKLIIPDAGTVPAPAAGTPSRPVAAEEAPPTGAGPGKWHVLESGDTFQTLSKKYYGTMTKAEQLAAANPNRNPTKLVVGTKVWIPEAPGRAGAAPERSRTAPPPPVESNRDTLPELSLEN